MDINDKNSPLRQRIVRQRATLYNMLIDPMSRVARRCAKVWGEKPALDHLLLESIPRVPYVTFLYALDRQGRQISANASQDGLIEEDFGRDRSERPYMMNLATDREMTLSEAYISLRVSRPSVTAIQRVQANGQLIGYLGGDFDLRGLPITKELYSEPTRWRQLKGDPAIRGNVFQQCRVQSRLDDQIDSILPVLEELIVENGVFHLKIHFSSSRATLWLLDDPYRYQLLDFDDLVDPDVCLAFPHHDYPSEAVVPQEQIRLILDTFKHLRFADDTIYLRAGSVNIFNGMVGLNFSCDGSHYIPADQFLARDSEFWEGIG
ncbi:MAG TPA: PDC sensor domain-containing protein [Gammaproteobacteria bacterium]|nr:PDC sensor domain-containing protein [Gammaproteobacteria bacterium]HPQ24867.1 PDC sensor domain-containing protein [Gammaproteobacteria bacterium]